MGPEQGMGWTGPHCRGADKPVVLAQMGLCEPVTGLRAFLFSTLLRLRCPTDPKDV